MYRYVLLTIRTHPSLTSHDWAHCHTIQGILRKGFDWSQWQANAAALSHAYHATFTRDYAGIEKVYGAGNTLYVRYESLKDKSTRVEALGEVAAFLKRPASKERLHCAFVLSENEKVCQFTISMTTPSSGYFVEFSSTCTGAPHDYRY